ncbi:MAG: hypothetical protein R3F46_14120 [bacterium]
MPQGSTYRLRIMIGFGLAWLVAGLPLALFAYILDDAVIWMAGQFTRQGSNQSFLAAVNIFATLLASIGLGCLLAVCATQCILLPLLSAAWNGVLGVRRSIFSGMRSLLWPALIHSAVVAFLLCVVSVFYVMSVGIGGMTELRLPVELLVFVACATGAWSVLPHAVDNFPGEWGLLAGSLGGTFALLILLPVQVIAVLSRSAEAMSLLVLAGCLLGGLVVGAMLPWLLLRDRGFWVELQEGGRLRSLRLGPRPLMAGNFPQAQLRVSGEGLPPLRLMLSGLTIFLEVHGEQRPRVIYPPFRIRLGEAELRVRSFDERDDWEELELPEPPEGAGHAREEHHAIVKGAEAAAEAELPEAVEVPGRGDQARGETGTEIREEG